MPQKRKRQAAGQSSPTAKNKTQTKTTLSEQSAISNRSGRSEATFVKSLHVVADLRRDPELTLSQAAKNRDVSPRSVRKYVASELKEDSSGRIRVTKSDRLRATLHIPSTKPDVLIPIHTQSSRERYLVGEWFASLNEAARGDFERLNRFPKGIVIDGVMLATEAREIQKILEAMEATESPFEHLYEVAG